MKALGEEELEECSILTTCRWWGEWRTQGGIPEQKTFGDRERVQSEEAETGGKPRLRSLGGPGIPPPSQGHSLVREAGWGG